MKSNEINQGIISCTRFDPLAIKKAGGFILLILLLTLVSIVSAGDTYFVIDENQVSPYIINQSQNTFENQEEGYDFWAGEIDESEGLSPVSEFSGGELGVLPYAQFSADPMQGYAPLDVQFRDLSTGNPDSWVWSVDDDRTVHEQNPLVRYEKPGTYMVLLKVSNEYGYDTTGAVIEVLDPEELEPKTALIADYGYFIEGNVLPMKVSFKDLTTGEPNKWKWFFGDGNESSEQNPIHYYDKSGSYEVKLIVQNNYTEWIKTGIIDVIVYEKPKAQFYHYKDLGKGKYTTNYVAPVNVQFKDASPGPATEWYWDFGDGERSRKDDPSHEYIKPGIYNVTLIVENYLGYDSDWKTVQVH